MAKPTPADLSGRANYQINPQLIQRRVADSTLVCVAGAGAIAGRAQATKLDSSATAILHLLHTPQDLESLTAAVARQYGASIETVRDDVEAALKIFVRQEWVHCS